MTNLPSAYFGYPALSLCSFRQSREIRSADHHEAQFCPMTGNAPEKLGATSLPHKLGSFRPNHHSEGSSCLLAFARSERLEPISGDMRGLPPPPSISAILPEG
ncbi:hypothetical protein RSAG8_05927, partial [Rhizoctonia solani AG-8 WAC10335]